MQTATAPADSLVPKQAHSSAEFVTDSLAMGITFALVLTVFGRIIGFLRGILFCRLMTDQQLGQWSLILSFLTLLAPLAVLGLPGCFGRFVEHFRQRDQMGPFVRQIALVSGLMTLTLSASMFAFSEAYSWFVFRDTGQTAFIKVMGLTLVVLSGMNFLISLMESLRQVRIVTVMRFVFGVVFAVVGCAFLLMWQDGTTAATVGYAVGCGAASVPAIWFLWKYRAGFAGGEPVQSGAMWRRIAPFAVWLWWANLFSNMFEVSDRYMLIHWSPATADVAQGYVGQYHSGRVVPLLLASVAAMLAGILMPFLTAAWEEGKKSAVRTQIKWTIKLVALSFTAAGLAVILGSPLLFDWILQGRYDGGLAVLPLTLVYCIWGSVSVVAQDYLWVREQGKQAFVVVAVALVANIFLNITLIPMYGLWGAVMATSLANALALLLFLGLNHRAGCTNDIGIWICATIPLVLLLPPATAITALVIVVLVGIRTSWLFSLEEKKQLAPLIANAIARMGDVISPNRG